MKRFIIGFLSLLALLGIISLILVFRAWQKTDALMTAAPPARTYPFPNAHVFYFSAAEAIKQPQVIDKLYGLPSSPSDPGFSLKEKEKILRLNAAQLKRMRQGFQYEYLEPPQPPQFVVEDEGADDTRKYRTLARLLALEGQVKSARGDVTGAARSYLEIIRLGTDLAKGGVLLSRVIGIGCQAVAHKPLWDLSGRMDAPQARIVSRRLEQLSSQNVPYHQTLANERVWVQACLTELIRHPEALMEEAYREDPELRTKAEGTPGGIWFGNLSGQIISRWSLFSYTKYMDEMITWAQKPYASHPPLPNPPRDAMSANFVEVYNKGWFRERRNLTQNHLLTVAYALRAYQQEKGQYPPNLDALKPAYLTPVLDDPFALKGPLRYRQEGSKYRLYSVGPDGKDDGGKPIDDPSKIDKSESKNPRARYYVNEGSKGNIVAGLNR